MKPFEPVSDAGDACLLRLDDVHFTYLAGTPLSQSVLHGVTFAVRKGEHVGLLGGTGSGKTTLLQTFNGLLRPGQGRVYVEGRDLAHAGADLVAIRRQVGLLFQFAEHQLFEETVAADVMFGPRQLGLSAHETEASARRALAEVGLPWDEVAARHPLALSGGERRRVALAGVLASGPSLLVLDEPTVGLDAPGRAALVGILHRLREDGERTLIMTSHDVDLVADLVDRVIVLEAGRVVRDGSVRDVLASSDRPSMGLGCPGISQVAHRLQAAGLDVNSRAVRVEELAQEVMWQAMKHRRA